MTDHTTPIYKRAVAIKTMIKKENKATYSTFIAVALSATALFTQGCSTTSVEITDTAYQSSEIKKGSPIEDLIVAMGEPTRVETVREQPLLLESWIYIRERSRTEMIDTGTIEVPYVNPITGEDGVMHEIVSDPQTTTQIDTITVYVSEGIVLSWKIQRKTDRDIAQ